MTLDVIAGSGPLGLLPFPAVRCDSHGHCLVWQSATLACSALLYWTHLPQVGACRE